MMSRICLTLALFSLLWVPAQAVGQAGFGQYEENPFVFALDIPGPADSAGGLVAADLNNDGLMDYLVTVPGHIAAYGHNGSKLWILNIDVRVGGSSEREGLPGHWVSVEIATPYASTRQGGYPPCRFCVDTGCATTALRRRQGPW